MVFLVLVLAVAVDFVVSAVVPGRAERFRQWLAPKLKRMENKADQAPGWWGTVLKGPFWASRKSLNLATDWGEEAHDKASN